LACCGAALIYAWTHGWDTSFVIFVLPFYVMPALLLWFTLERRFFLPRKFEPVGSSVQTLGL